MKKEIFKKLLAVGVSAAMFVGGALPVLAASGDGVTDSGDGQGTSTGHLDDTYVEASVPTDKTIETLFSFYVDPEDIIGKGGKFDGSTAVTKVNDLVYFPATSGYASTSQDLEITIKNYKAVDVAVTATVDADTTGLITLVDDATGISTTEAADDAALYLTLTVGEEDPVAITAEGASSTYEQDAQAANFDVTGSVEAGFTVAPKSTPASDWAKVAISLAGKAQLVNDATDIVAPKVTLEYTIALHDDTPVQTTISAQNNTITIPAGKTVTKVEKTNAAGTKVTISSGTSYTVSGTTLTISNTNMLASTDNVGGKITVTFNDDSTAEYTIVADE